MADIELKRVWQNWCKDADIAIDAELEDGTKPCDWLKAGLGPKECEICVRAGAFDPESCAELLAAEIDLDAASRRPTEEEEDKYGLPYRGYSLAYMHSNGDLYLDEIKKMIS